MTLDAAIVMFEAEPSILPILGRKKQIEMKVI